MKENRSHVLIVDDNVTNLQVTTRFLKNEGYLISLAQDGKSVLSELEVWLPDLILLDIMMPVMDGIEVCKRLKENEKTRSIPVIFLTAKNQPNDLVEAFNAGAVDYITKPFNKEELLARVKTHTDLSLARKKVIEMNKTRDKLYSIIAHDIKTPFANIILVIEAIKNNQIEVGTSIYNDLINRLEEGSKNTFALLENLLIWTRSQTEHLKINYDFLDLSVILKDCIQLFKPIAESKNIEITVDIPNKCIAFFDEVTMHTTFRNLISNAIKFTKEGGIIRIFVQDEREYKKVTFSDTGVGIPDDIIKMILVKDEAYTTYGTNNEAGTGLGLMMVKDFVQKNKGRVIIDSESDRGTDISILIPVKN